MTARPCDLADAADIEIYFYGELDPADRGRVERHLAGCAECRQQLDDLHAIRRALASRPAVAAPPAGDWSGFMRRLDAAVGASTARTPALPRPEPRVSRPWASGRLAAFAAMLAIVTIGVLLAARFRTSATQGLVARAPVVTAAVGTKPVTRAAAPDRALREASAEHLERSKLVVLGLATRDPRVQPDDWLYERTLAGALLADTRLYRQAAADEGAADVARVMRDLETVLLEASMSQKSDRQALERVQRLIARRDLVLKMQVASEAGRAGD